MYAVLLPNISLYEETVEILMKNCDKQLGSALVSSVDTLPTEFLMNDTCCTSSPPAAISNTQRVCHQYYIMHRGVEL